ncbi:transposase [Streptomyces sp. NPDC001292]|uniref:transposase n=1 Tax=Streptomyces sp. NPDC001292 TaxID=3364558 RepID=UPI0036748A85
MHRFFTRWRRQGLIDEFHDRLRAATRDAEGRDAEPTAGVIDSQSAKGTSAVEAATSGYDGEKKIKGRKRHIVVDILGLILAVMVTPASTGGRDAAQDLLSQATSRHHRTFAWLTRSRRLARDYERLPASSEAMILWSMTMVMARRLCRHRRRTGPASARAPIPAKRAA